MSYGADKLKMGWILTFTLNWTFNVIVDCAPQNNRDLNQGGLHLWSKFEQVMSYRADKLDEGRTDGGRQRQYPEAKTGLG